MQFIPRYEVWRNNNILNPQQFEDCRKFFEFSGFKTTKVPRIKKQGSKRKEKKRKSTILSPTVMYLFPSNVSNCPILVLCASDELLNVPNK